MLFGKRSLCPSCYTEDLEMRRSLELTGASAEGPAECSLKGKAEGAEPDRMGGWAQGQAHKPRRRQEDLQASFNYRVRFHRAEEAV